MAHVLTVVFENLSYYDKSPFLATGETISQHQKFNAFSNEFINHSVRKFLL